MKIIKFFAWF